MKQLRSPDPWYPAAQDGVQEDPEERVEGQFPAAPLVGDVLAFRHGMSTQVDADVAPAGVVFPSGQLLLVH